LKGAPVIVETNPTHENILGRIEQEGQVPGADFLVGWILHKAMVVILFCQ
jgi:hypothetical protein